MTPLTFFFVSVAIPVTHYCIVHKIELIWQQMQKRNYLKFRAKKSRCGYNVIK